LWHTHEKDKASYRAIAIIFLLSFVALSVFPVLLAFARPGLRDDLFSNWMISSFYDFHAVVMAPVVACLTIVGFVTQIYEIRAHCGTNNTALSRTGLAKQATTLAFIALSWPWALTYPQELFQDGITLRSAWVWYGLIGWMVVDNLTSATLHVLLWLYARRTEGAQAPRDWWIDADKKLPLDGPAEPVSVEKGFVADHIVQEALDTDTTRTVMP
jgi:hypothetical protein